MITDFKTWFEDAQMMQQQNSHPASAEVIRSGMQPQVGEDGQFSMNKQKEDHDKIMALDGQVQRIQQIIESFQPITSQGQKAKKLVNQFCEYWGSIMTSSQTGGDKAGLGYASPSDQQLDYMQKNQPLPEPTRNGMMTPTIF